MLVMVVGKFNIEGLWVVIFIFMDFDYLLINIFKRIWKKINKKVFFYFFVVNYEGYVYFMIIVINIDILYI